MSTTTSTPTRTEWRKKKVDRSKRVAPGATIDEKNIIKSSRRKGAKLTVEQRNKENKSGNKSPKPKAEKKEKVVEEQVQVQIEEEEEEEIVEKVEKKAEKKTEKKVEKKAEKKTEKVEEVKTPMQEVTEQVENLQVTEKKKTPTKTRKTPTKKEQKKVVSKVHTQIERLGATPKEQIGEKRFYRDLKEPMPQFIQMFCDSFVGKEEVNYSSSTHKLEEVKLGQEFALEEFEDFKYLKKDDILIGDGDCLIVANNKDSREDFEVYLVADEDSKPVGPFKISDFLKSLEVSEIEGEEEE
jgi:hypothetical protein